MGCADDATPDASAARLLVEALEGLNRRLSVPTPAAHGIDPARWRAAIPLMAVQALASGSPANNPRIPSAAEIERLYEQVWD
jgi:alcohol dehydrogenase class IV